MKGKMILAVCCFFCQASLDLFGQQGTVSSGGNATGTGGNVSYSIGQMDYNSATGTNGNIIEGLQQPFEISEISGIEEKDIELYSAIYPNPSSGTLVLKIENENYDKYTYMIYDELGKVIMSKRVEESETTIDLSNYSNAKYFLKVSEKEKELKSYQILKVK